MCESKLNGQTDTHSDYSAHLWVVQNFDSLLLLMFSICKIDIVIFGRFLRCNFVMVLHTSGWTMFKLTSMRFDLLDFFCSGIQFNLLLSPYPCFISLLYLDLYVLGDDALIS